MKKTIATFTILIVSGSAFFAGYYQNEIIEDANEVFEKSEKHQTNALRIEQESKRLYDFDLLQDQRAQDSYNQAWNDAQQIVILEDDLTATELTARQYDVYAKIFYGRNLFFDSYSWRIVDFFLDTPDDTLFITTESKDGYNYEIRPEEYEANDPVNVFTIDEFLGPSNWNFPSDIIDFLKSFDETLSLFGEIDFFNLNVLLSNQLWWEQNQVIQNREIGNELILQANSLTRSVSITTVGVILATSMAARLNEKETEAQFEAIKYNLGEDTGDVKFKDSLSLPVLSAAIILSIAGLFLAL